MNLADALVPKTYSKGDLIIKQGDVADGMYFIEDGIVNITILGETGSEVSKIVRLLKFLFVCTLF